MSRNMGITLVLLILSVIFWFMAISPYRIFAVVNICVGVLVAAYAIYDIKTDTGWFSGLIGVLLLIIVIPIVATFLLADFTI